MPVPSSKILVMRLSSLGDLALLLPALMRLKQTRPSPTVHLLTKRRYAELFEGFSAVDRLFTIEGRGIGELAAIRRTLAAEAYDTLVDAHGVFRTAALFRTIPASRKIRIEKNEIEKFLLIAFKLDRYREIVPQAERYERLVDALGLGRSREEALLPLPVSARETASKAIGSFGGGAPLVAFAPGARWDTKVWPADRFEELVSRAGKAGAAAVLIGGPEDALRNAGVAERARPRPLDLTGRLSILGSMAVLERCAALVTNDSAPLHLAEAVGTPVVAFYGPTVRSFGYFPRRAGSVALEHALRCRPCSRNGARACPYGTKECLTAVSVDRAQEALERVLAAKGARG